VRDPFNLPGEKKAVTRIVKSVISTLPPLRSVLPTHDIFSGVSVSSQLPSAPPSTALPGLLTSTRGPTQIAALPRVSGIVNLNGVHAIIQSPGGPETVDPGDNIRGVGRVTSIQPDGITVRTTSGQTIQIPISAGNPVENGGYPGGPSYPGGTGYPGGPSYPGGAGAGYPGGPSYPGGPGGPGYPGGPGGPGYPGGPGGPGYPGGPGSYGGPPGGYGGAG
jgi:hypothetical protein